MLLTMPMRQALWLGALAAWFSLAGCPSDTAVHLTASRSKQRSGSRHELHTEAVLDNGSGCNGSQGTKELIPAAEKNQVFRAWTMVYFHGRLSSDRQRSSQTRLTSPHIASAERCSSMERSKRTETRGANSSSPFHSRKNKGIFGNGRSL
jgi:hypothetical protein